MKTIYTILLSCLIPGTGAFAQIQPAVKDPAAEPILDYLAETFSNDKAYHIEFRYEIESVADNYQTEDFGSVIVKGRKYKLITEEGEVFFNGSKMWTFNPVNQEVYVSTPDPEDMDQLITVPFTLLADYRKYFKYRLRDDVSIGGKSHYEIDLYPESLQSSYSTLRLQVEKGTNRLHSLTLQQKNGMFFRIYITEMIANLTIKDSTFEWDEKQNPDVLLIEL